MKKLVLTFFTLFLFQTPAFGTTKIGISGDKFTINDKETFLLGVSYFDAFNWHASDLDRLNTRGYNLIRVWLDWEDRGLFDPDGNLTWEQQLVDLVEASDTRGLVVDVTILDGSFSFGPSNREKAVRQVVSALKSKPNVIFDIMNAHDSGEHALSHTQVKTLIEAAMEEDPNAIIAVSSRPEHLIKDETLEEIHVDEELNAGVTALTPHLPRTSDWYSRTQDRVTRIKNYLNDRKETIPLYLQEEVRRGHNGLYPTQGEFLHAAKAALSAGAAAWIFHTAAGFDLAGGSLFSQLDAVEKSTIDALPKAIFGSDTTLTATATSTANDTSTKNTLSEDLASAPQQQPNTTEQSPSASAATLSARATGATYYVDTNHPSASDSNPGTTTQPWKTIQKAANTLVAGDTVYIKQGTYGGFVSAKNSGTASGWITYSAYPGHEHKAILDGSPFEIRGKSYIKLSGLRIQNVNTGSWNGIDIIGPGSNITISNNYTYNTKGSGISGWGGPYPTIAPEASLTDLIIENNKVGLANNGGWNENITVANGVDRFEIKNNELWSNSSHDNTNGGEGIDAKFGVRNGKIYGNYVHDLERIGIYVDGWDRYATNIEIFNNRVINTIANTATGITVGKERNGGVVDGIKIYNNIVSGWARNGIDLFRHPGDDGLNMRNITIINNTTYNNGYEANHGGGGIAVTYPTATNVIVRNNIAYKNSDFQIQFTAGSGSISSNNLTTDPQFVNEAGKDFHLKSTSPAINTGLSSLAPTKDYDGVSRPQDSAFDIGAYEVCAGTCSGGGGDATRPTVSITAPANGATVSGTMTVSANASDNVAVTSVAFKVDGTTLLTDAAAPYSMSWNTTSVSKGSHALSAVASDAAGNTTTSTVVTVTVDNVPASDTTPPSNPTGLTATAISSSQINLAWTASTDNVAVTGYRVERCQGSGCTNFTQVAIPTGTTYSDTGLSASTLYQYRVRAADTTGNLSGYSTNASATTQGGAPSNLSVTVDKAAITPVINGQLSESGWNLQTSIAKSVIGAANNPATFDVLWDNTYLYVGVKVLDSILYDDSANVWDDDSVDIYIDANHSHSTAYDASDLHLVKGYNDTSLYARSNDTTGILHASAAITGGYTIEMAIPWSKLGVTPTANMTIGFDLAVNDDDDGSGRDSQVMWNGTTSNYQNTSAFGHAVLGAGPSALSLTGDKVSTAPVINGQLSESGWDLQTSIAKSVIGAPNDSATFDVLWDSTYPYVGVKVLDSILNNDSTNVWDDDSVDIYIDANHSHSTTYDANDLHLVKGYNDASLFATGGNTTGVLHNWAVVPGGYTIEMAIPWTKLGVTPTNNMTIGVDIAVNDDDSGGDRDSQSMWNNTTPTSYQNTSNFGHVVLNAASQLQ